MIKHFYIASQLKNKSVSVIFNRKKKIFIIINSKISFAKTRTVLKKQKKLTALSLNEF